MGVVLCIAIAFIALSAGRYVRKRRQHRRAASDPLRRVFGPRELRQLNRHLERIAVDELRRLEVRAARYVAGDAGYVVVVSGSRHGIGLGLSDGHRLELGGVSRSTLKLLEQGATEQELRPARVRRYGFFSYGLLLRGEAGADMEIFADRVTLAL
jgi:hypothetical protein